MNLGIIGTGGFAKETMMLAETLSKESSVNFENLFYVEFDDFHNNDFIGDTKVLKISSCDFSDFKFVIAIANNKIRENISNELGDQANYTSLISLNSFISTDIIYEEGLIVMPYSYVTCNVKIGKHAQLNTSCSIGHDTEIGNFLTMVSGARIAGNNFIGDRAYFAANSTTIQGVKITNDVKVGLNSSIIRNVLKPGTYFGTPAKYLSL